MTIASTTQQSAPEFLKLLANDLRWQLVSLLSQSDYRVQELVERVNRPMNLVSYHLGQLHNDGLVAERRSNADSRAVYYSVDLDRMHDLFAASQAALHPVLAAPQEQARPEATAQPAARVLFLCTHNSARSQMAEALLRHEGGDLVVSSSAGTHPAFVHPYAIEAMADRGIDIRHHRAKHLDEFAGQPFDRIITVCDRAREQCPVFPGNPEQIHWSLTDPAAVQGSENEQRLAFRETASGLARRVHHLVVSLKQPALTR